MKIWQFMLLVGFLWVYIFIAKKFDTHAFTISKGLRDRLLAWIWVGIGVVFAIANTVVLFFSPYWEHGFLKALFVWFCMNGIFAVLVIRVIFGLIKCIAENRKQRLNSN
jgi:hypothetical protein